VLGLILADVDVNAHAPVLSSSNTASDLLAEVTAIQAVESGTVLPYGFDDGSRERRIEEGRLVDPATADLMSDCSPWWISELTFSTTAQYRLTEENELEVANHNGSGQVAPVLFSRGIPDREA